MPKVLHGKSSAPQGSAYMVTLKNRIAKVRIFQRGEAAYKENLIGIYENILAIQVFWDTRWVCKFEDGCIRTTRLSTWPCGKAGFLLRAEVDINLH